MRVLGVVLVASLLAAGCQTVTEEDPQPETPQVSVVPTGVPPVSARPSPSPEPTPDGGTTPPPDSGEFIPDNDNPVAWIRAKVYFVECGGTIVPGSEHATQAGVGCRVHLDVTPKDSSDKPTRAKGLLLWNYGGTPASYTGAAASDYTPTLTILAPGELVALASVDGVTSNTVRVTLK